MEKKKKTEIQTSCDTCAYLIYDEEYEEYVCDVSMDEDEIMYSGTLIRRMWKIF